VNLELILFDADRTLFDYDRAESDALTSDIAGGLDSELRHAGTILPRIPSCRDWNLTTK